MGLLSLEFRERFCTGREWKGSAFYKYARLDENSHALSIIESINKIPCNLGL